MPHEPTNAQAMDSILAVVYDLRELGFVVTGALAISKPKQFSRGEIIRFDESNGRYSQVRLIPKPATPPATVDSPAVLDVKPHNVPTNAEERGRIAMVTVGDMPVGPGIVNSGVAFERRGSCLYVLIVGCHSAVVREQLEMHSLRL